MSTAQSQAKTYGGNSITPTAHGQGSADMICELWIPGSTSQFQEAFLGERRSLLPRRQGTTTEDSQWKSEECADHSLIESLKQLWKGGFHSRDQAATFAAECQHISANEEEDFLERQPCQTRGGKRTGLQAPE
ncbi:hypothetical protein LSTR_LSTR009584 [Laodelphax striatellus]|uniref:Uncharacterized protein n=1 Tax=Laodelphax striatellus TaxID=195883 RepID=A0A482WR21_LAOST|nr:hypothetical protein LSTR_LSTR009584 [Laodelphax striatellus]